MDFSKYRIQQYQECFCKTPYLFLFYETKKKKEKERIEETN